MLAWAGLGSDSILAVVEDVLWTTFTSLGLYSNAKEVLQGRRDTRFVPFEQFQLLLEKIQPELVYSLLLQCSNWNQRCLDVWKSLTKKLLAGRHSAALPGRWDYRRGDGAGTSRLCCQFQPVYRQVEVRFFSVYTQRTPVISRILTYFGCT